MTVKQFLNRFLCGSSSICRVGVHSPSGLFVVIPMEVVVDLDSAVGVVLDALCSKVQSFAVNGGIMTIYVKEEK